MKKKLVLFLLCGLLLLGLALAERATRHPGSSATPGMVRSTTSAFTDPFLSGPLRVELQKSMDRGAAFLVKRQKANGSWDDHPGITGMVCVALQESVSPSASSSEAIAKAHNYLSMLAKPDGAIYDRDLPGYSTAIALRALGGSKDPKFATLIRQARDFLVGLQSDEGEGYNPEDSFYGGVGYGNDLRPDLANLEHTLAALKAAQLPEDHPAWEKAIKFIQRSQNFSETNDQAWSGNDGGFVYYPGFSYAEQGGTHSYGSMTYAGLMSYSYARVKRDDPRVRAALEWVRTHYTVDENPGMGLKTLYYYYLVFAKALKAYGEPVIFDSGGRSRNWREDLGRKLLELQYEEGYWVNEDPAWWQDNPVLVTAFTVQTLAQILSQEE